MEVWKIIFLSKILNEWCVGSMLIFQGVYLAIRPDTAGQTGVRYTLEYPRGTDDMCSQFLHQLHGVGTEIHPFLWTMSIEKTWTNNVAWLCSKPKVEPETKSQSHCVSWGRISRHHNSSTYHQISSRLTSSVRNFVSSPSAPVSSAGNSAKNCSGFLIKYVWSKSSLGCCIVGTVECFSPWEGFGMRCWVLPQIPSDGKFNQLDPFQIANKVQKRTWTCKHRGVGLGNLEKMQNKHSFINAGMTEAI